MDSYVLTGKGYAHRLVMQEFLGRDLAPNEEVHHKNGVKGDNRLSNLAVVDRSRHRSEHAKRWSRYRTVPVNGAVRECAECGKEYRSRHKGNIYCSRDCLWKKRRTITDKMCANCGKRFRPHPGAKGTFCSGSCSGEWRVGRGRSVLAPEPVEV